MTNVRSHELRRVTHGAAVARQVERLGSPREFLQRSHVIAHRPIGRRHHRRRPGHDVIAGEQEIRLLQRKGHVVGGMAGRRDRLDRPARARDDFAISKRAVGTEIGVVARVQSRGLTDIERARGTMCAFGEDHGAGCGFDPRHGGGMVAMGVGNENVGDGFPAHGIEQRGDMRLVEWTGIDDGDLPAAHDIGDGPLEREWPGIVGEEAPHAGHHLLYRFRREIKALVERNVRAHARRTHVPAGRRRTWPRGPNTNGHCSRFVMRGLDPRIHRKKSTSFKVMDCRVKPGND